MSKSFCFSLIFLFSTIYSFAQKNWAQDIHNEEKSLYEIQEAFENYWENKTIGKGKGWKPFKRREAFMEPRVYPSGFFPYEQLYTEYNKLMNQPKSTSQAPFEANWQAYGPTQVPLQNNGRKRGVGRINNVTFNPNDDNILWAGSPSGGLWKSIDGGQNWTSNTDLLPNLGVSDIAIDPTNTDIMYIITGDRDADDTYAYGLMKSTDGGESWNTTGLSFNINSAYRGNRILINPNNTNILIVSTRKSGYGETFRSTDGGQNWELVLQGPNLISMEFNPTNSNHIYAVTTGTSKYYRSYDNGVTWNNVTNDSGLPNSGNTRAVVAVTPANPNVVYILYSAGGGGFGGLYKSTDGGYNFTLQSNSPNILSWEVDGSGADGQGSYDLALAVSPTNEDIVFTGGINIWKSTNGGVDFNISSHWYGADDTEYVHADQHILKYNPSNGILYSGNDGGLYKSEDNGIIWTDISDDLQITQFYKIGISQSNYGLLIGGTQDNGTLRCNSENDWDAVRGGDGMECAIDPTDPSIMYSEVYYGAISISTDGGQSWNDIAPDTDGAWITPYEIDQNNPSRIVIGYDNVYESLDYGSNWEMISGTFNNSGNIDVIALSTNSDVIYISETEEIYKTIDGGENWTNISSSLPNNTVTDIAIHPTDENRVWITFSGYSSGNKVFYSNDGGTSWANISDDLPNLPANCILFYPPNETLFAGTDIGVFYKDSSMTNWEYFNQGLPNVIVTELEYHINSNSLFAGTYGRGVWATNLPSTAPPVASFNYSIVDECSGLVSFNNTSSNSSSVEWNFGDNNSSSEENSTHQYLNDGTYQVKLVATNSLGTDTIYQNITIDILDMPIASDNESCTPSSLELTATSNNPNAEINWYDSPLNGNLLATGENYTTEVLNATTVFYVSTTEVLNFGNIGPTEHEGNNEYSSSASSVGSLVFSAYESFILESVDVFTNQAGERKIVLLDENDNVLLEHTENVPVADNNPHTIVLDFMINPGLNYKLATDNAVSIANFGGENPQFKRTGNAVPLYFPYNYDNTLSITSSYWGNETLTDYYYYFYNWRVKEICSSPCLAVEAKIGSNEVLTINTSECPYDSVILNASGNFTSFEWSNQSSNPNLTVYESGEYSVSAYDSAGCIATESINIPLIQSFDINSNEVLCEGSSIFLQCLSGLDSYTWNTGESTNVISVSSSGIYSVIATDANGCELNDEIEINSIEPIQAVIQTEMDSLIVCKGSEFSFNIASTFSSAVWNESFSALLYTGTASSLGDNIISVLAQDENGCYSNDSIILKVVDCASLEEYLANTTLYPNPTTSEFIIQHQSLNNDIQFIEVLDLQGRIVEQRKADYTNGILFEKFDLSELSSGIYLVELMGKKGKTVKKVILD
ncbi:MAG: T9SS type A sorting domain-containing protein [Flavobacteriales bacterium]|nr:T9SS type A sorting domain-containing protein [Flavobacteriales bacterium]